jgi:hypothetical protein
MIAESAFEVTKQRARITSPDFEPSDPSGIAGV